MSRLIDAERLKEVFERYVNAPHVKVFGKYSDGMQLAINTCIEFLDSQRTVDAVPVVHGRWERISWWQHKKHYEMDKCSVCGHQVKVKDAHNYCPNCGAYMRERSEGE